MDMSTYLLCQPLAELKRPPPPTSLGRRRSEFCLCYEVDFFAETSPKGLNFREKKNENTPLPFAVFICCSSQSEPDLVFCFLLNFAFFAAASVNTGPHSAPEPLHSTPPSCFRIYIHIYSTRTPRFYTHTLTHRRRPVSLLLCSQNFFSFPGCFEPCLRFRPQKKNDDILLTNLMLTLNAI